MMTGGWKEMDTLRTYLADKLRSTCPWVRCGGQGRRSCCGWIRINSGRCSWLGGGPKAELGSTRSDPLRG